MSAKDGKPRITNTNDGKKLQVGAWDSLNDPAYHKARHVILANLQKAAPERVCMLCYYSLLHDCPNYEFGIMLHCKDCCKMADQLRYIRTWKNYERALRDLAEDKWNIDHDGHPSDAHLAANQDADPIRPFVYNDYHVFPQEGIDIGEDDCPRGGYHVFPQEGIGSEGEKDDCPRGGYRYGNAAFHQIIYNDLGEEEEKRNDRKREGDA